MQKNQKYDTVVVGSGPNGLAAGITLARAGLSVLLIEARDEIGGGMRSSDISLPGFLHDICSSVHPLGVSSPFFRSLDLKAQGLEWIFPPASLAHPLDDGSTVMLERSVDATAETLGRDGDSYRKLMRPLANNWEELCAEILQPLHFPAHPLMLAKFGLVARYSIDQFICKYTESTEAQALLAGIAAHSVMPTGRPGGASFALLLGAAGHAVGWPVARGGSRSIAEALKSLFISAGGEVQVGMEVHSLGDLPPSKARLLDLTPRQLLNIAGQRFSPAYKLRLGDYRYGPGIFKMDWALDGPIPWKAANCLRAATVHLGGTYQEVSAAENAVWEGKHPEKPFVILVQPSLFDPGRAPIGKHTAWAYCHVPNGSVVDMTEKIESQVERFAPGFKEIILKRCSMNTTNFENYNANYVGGDISGGAEYPIGRLLKPLGSWRSYSTPLKGVYLCSSSMPPGAGVHGMCGYQAAKLALREVFKA
jgi:phytoene dehydrogenase-like protein